MQGHPTVGEVESLLLEAPYGVFNGRPRHDQRYGWWPLADTTNLGFLVNEVDKLTALMEHRLADAIEGTPVLF